MQESILSTKGHDEERGTKKICEKQNPNKVNNTTTLGKSRQRDQAGTSKDGENLLVVSFIQQGKDEKQGRYKEYKKRRMERNLRTMALKGYVNTISGG